MYDGYYTWMLVSASLVLLMTAPGLALFYGGMSRSKSVLNMMMMSFSALGVIGIVYVLWGWSMSYSSLEWAAADPDKPGFEVAKLFASPFDQFGLTDTLPAPAARMPFRCSTSVVLPAPLGPSRATRSPRSTWRSTP